MARITGGEVLKRCLVQEGVKYIFGVPGDQLYPLLDAIYKDKRIEFITMRHEAAAAHAADAWARMTGQPGVCIGTVGPGAANLIGGVYPAFADGIPIIVITAQNQTWRSYPDQGSQQGLDQLTLFKAVTKWNAVVSHWKRIPELTHWAFRAALSGRPGPVHLDFPSDVLFQTEEETEVEILSQKSYRAVEKPVGSAALIDQAARMLVEAKMPLIHAGGGVLRSGASKELIELAEYLQAPVTTSMSGRGSIPEDHPLCLIPAAPGNGAIVAQAEADVVLVVGCRLGALDMWGKPPAWGESPKQKVIQIDIAGEMIGLNRPVDLGIVGDAKPVLKALLEAVKRYALPRKENPLLQDYKRLEKMWLENFEDMSRLDTVPIHPLRVVREVREFFPRDAITVVDGGNTAVWCFYLNRVYEPNTYLSCVSGDSGHLGAGIPYAIAAKLANPERQVYCITGDGAFGLNIQELETASRLQLPIVFVVLNDCAWGMIRAGQTLFYSRRHIGVDFSDIRYDEIARGMNCYGERVIEPSQIKPALQRAVDSGKPAVLDVKIDREVIPPDFTVLASIWLDGCELPEEEREILKEEAEIVQR
ncbi:MAG: thiamine pyrophosphate-binding protein [Thermoproteota archaeon]|nr:thiamine pyrophosphate-binding protein [Candidatus Bathyarchaeota archaeon]